MNDVLSRRYHSEVSLDTIALYMDSLLSVVGLNRDFTILEVDGMGKFYAEAIVKRHPQPLRPVCSAHVAINQKASNWL